MIRETHELESDPEALEVLRQLGHDGSLIRPGAQGLPFHVENSHLTPDRFHASAELVLRMVAGGLLLVTNGSKGWTRPDGRVVPDLPWRVRQTPLGEIVRRAHSRK